MEKEKVAESGGTEHPGASCSRGGTSSGWVLRAVLLVAVGILLLPVLIPLMAVLGSLTLGLLGVGLALVISLIAVCFRVVLLVVQLFFGILGLALTTLPWILAVFGVLYLIEKLDESEA